MWLEYCRKEDTVKILEGWVGTGNFSLLCTGYDTLKRYQKIKYKGDRVMEQKGNSAKGPEK